MGISLFYYSTQDFRNAHVYTKVRCIHVLVSLIVHRPQEL